MNEINRQIDLEKNKLKENIRREIRLLSVKLIWGKNRENENIGSDLFLREWGPEYVKTSSNILNRALWTKRG